MGVVLFQAVIVATIVFAGQRRLPIVLGWSAFTLLMVFMPWLMVLQLAVIWATYVVCDRSGSEGSGVVVPASPPREMVRGDTGPGAPAAGSVVPRPVWETSAATSDAPPGTNETADLLGSVAVGLIGTFLVPVLAVVAFGALVLAGMFVLLLLLM